jgi:outer membrane lipoprotein-sorting protein
MSEFKFSCPNCGQHILCDAAYSGNQINCPSCQGVIVVPPAPGATAAPPAMATRYSTATPAAGQRFPGAGAPPKKKSGALKTVLRVTAALVGAAIGFFGVQFAMHHFGAGKGNPAAQVSAPTADAAVQALSILSKMHSSYTNLTSVSADSTITVSLDLSKLTMADVNPDLPANEHQYANQHPRGMPNILTNTTDITMKSAPSNCYYFAGEAVSEMDHRFMTNTFAYWSSDKGRFMFTDSHLRGMKATYMQLPDMDPANNPAEQLKNLQHTFEDPAQLTKIIRDLGQTADEPVNGQDCYTLTAKVFGQKVKVWVDKNSYLIMQSQITLGGAVSDADVDDAFSFFASSITNIPPAQLDMMKAQVKKMTPAVAKIRGVITSTCQNVETNPKLSDDDFDYSVPPGVKLTRLQDMLGKNRRPPPH